MKHALILLAMALCAAALTLAREEPPALPAPPVPPNGGPRAAMDAALPISARPDRRPLRSNSLSHLVDALPHVARGEHYVVHTDVSEHVADDSLQLLEAAWPLFCERFGREAVAKSRDGRLPIFIYGCRDVYRFRRYPGMEPWVDRASGFYDRIHGIGHVEYASFPYSQRRLVLHEAAHQFHYLSLGKGRRDIFPRWYVEGVANDLERHEWDGRQLRLGVHETPFTVGHEDIALAWFQSPQFDLPRVLGGSALSWIEDDRDRRAVGFVLVRYLRQSRFADWFARFEQCVSAGIRAPSFPREARLRDVQDDVIRFAQSILPARSTPQYEWRRRADRVEACVRTGSSGFWPFLERVDDAVPVSIGFEVDSELFDSDGIGFVVGYRDSMNYTVVVFKRRLEQLLITTRENGSWSRERYFDLDPVSEPRGAREARGIDLELELTAGGTIRVAREGQIVATDEAPLAGGTGRLGFWGESDDLTGANHGTRTFRFGRVRSNGAR